MKTMSSKHAVFSLGYHIIGCTKYRHAVLDDAIAIELKRIIAETCGVYGWLLQEIEVMPDHGVQFQREFADATAELRLRVSEHSINPIPGLSSPG